MREIRTTQIEVEVKERGRRPGELTSARLFRQTADEDDAAALLTATNSVILNIDADRAHHRHGAMNAIGESIRCRRPDP